MASIPKSAPPRNPEAAPDCLSRFTPSGRREFTSHRYPWLALPSPEHVARVEAVLDRNAAFLREHPQNPSGVSDPQEIITARHRREILQQELDGDAARRSVGLPVNSIPAWQRSTVRRADLRYEMAVRWQERRASISNVISRIRSTVRILRPRSRRIRSRAVSRHGGSPKSSSLGGASAEVDAPGIRQRYVPLTADPMRARFALWDERAALQGER